MLSRRHRACRRALVLRRRVLLAWKAHTRQRGTATRGRCAGASSIPEDQIKSASALLMPGKADNETIIVREEGTLWAYAWSTAACEWSKLGEVTNGPPTDTVEAPKKVRSRAVRQR